MKKEFPVYDICKFSYSQEDDIIVKPLAPYLRAMRKLHFPHRHDFYHLIFFTQGGGSHTIDFEKFEIKPYHGYFMAPGQVHGWDFEGDIDGYVINFSAGFFKPFLLNNQYLENFTFLNGNIQHSVIDIDEQYRSPLTELLNKVLVEAESTGRFRLDKLRIMLLEFFFLIAEIKGESGDVKSIENHNQIVIRNFEKLIDKHYLQLRLPKDYAELLCVTPSYLNSICKELLGLSAGNLIRNRIVLEAKRMLINLELTVTEIAYKLNFSDNSYFCKLFKNQEGVSPETFRKTL
ncbi:AraC family transcriptional regulator [Niastella koreensis]|uniref:Transcriptional regulator, AraC family n=2 Tax=Niastella koreensis TaxID=354356 RepID=G8TJE1_NIAKG|nr:helix-turn-helix domain-containing protein [Niastella koreensis]AEV99676.1 transcriptional regulator, AraC family [Niastella koreensis GR20-10]OQP44300.1 AraC family transcriptional regulator [Niastella koreensis]